MLRMCISLRTHAKDSCFKVAEYVYHSVLMPRKVVLNLRNVNMTVYSCQGKLFYSCGWVYHCVLIARKVVLILRMCISLRTHSKEGFFKDTECIYLCVLMPRAVVLKLRNVYFTAY